MNRPDPNWIKAQDLLDQVDPHVRLDRHDLVPRCVMERCRHFDGKRCGITGEEPEQTCRPGVAELIRQARFIIE